MANHSLKSWPADFAAVLEGRKRHEARRDDRGFAVGDFMRLREWIPTAPDACTWQTSSLAGHYTGRSLLVLVTHVTRGEYGLPPELAIMSIRCLGLLGHPDAQNGVATPDDYAQFWQLVQQIVETWKQEGGAHGR